MKKKKVEELVDNKFNLGSWKDKLMVGLVAVLVVASFVVGLLLGKVSVYEKLSNQGSLQAKQPTASNQPTATQSPEPEVVLTDDQKKKMVEGAIAVKGDNNAKVAMVEFTDYQCPFCSRYVTDAYTQIIKNFVDTGKVKYILRDLPLSFHPNAKPAALAARCAGEQGKYWEMHDVLFGKQEEWSSLSDAKTKFSEYAGSIGLSVGKFDGCVSSGKYNQAIDDDANLASSVGANGTPTFYINGKQVVGALPYATFEQEINAALK